MNVNRLARCLLMIFTVMLPAGIGLKSQDKTAPQQIRVHASEVIVDANVTDSGGKPVRGLAQSDFEVFEDGIKQQISSFRYISAASQDRIQVTVPEAKAQSDVVPFTTSYPRLISLVFDKVAMQQTDALRAASAATEFVTKYLRKDEMAAVFGIGSGIRIYQQFTNDPARLVRGIQEVTSSQVALSGDVSSEIQTALRSIPQGLLPNINSDEDLLAAAYNAGPSSINSIPALYDLLILLKFRDMFRTITGNRSLSGLLSIVEGQKIMPGRKSVILFSSGFVQPSGPGVYPVGTDVRAVTGAANLAGVTFYTLNTTGMAINDPDQDSQSALRTASKSVYRTVGPDTPLGQLSRNFGLNTADNLKMLAEQTGGYAVSNTNDLTPEMAVLGANIDEYYVFTYMPANPVQDGKFRAISVKLRRSGLNISSRKGYYAFPDTDRQPLLGFEAELLEAANAKKPPSNFSVLVGGFSFPGPDAATTAALLVQFPLAPFKFEKIRDSRNSQAKADIILLVKDSNGSVVHRFSRQCDLESPPEQVEATRQKEFSFYRKVTLPPGDYLLEAAVRDRATGKVSVTKGKFGIAPSGTQDLRISNVVVSGNPSKVIIPDAGTNAGGGEDPLKANGRNVAPDLSAAYRKSTDKSLIVYFSAQTLKSLMPILCTLDLIRDGVPELQIQRSLYDTAGRAVPCLLEVGLDQLKPGKYEMRVTAKDKQGSISDKADFVVVQ